MKKRLSLYMQRYCSCIAGGTPKISLFLPDQVECTNTDCYLPCGYSLRIKIQCKPLAGLRNSTRKKAVHKYRCEFFRTHILPISIRTPSSIAAQPVKCGATVMPSSLTFMGINVTDGVPVGGAI